MAALVSITDLQAFCKRTFTGDDLTQAVDVLSGISALARAVAGQSWSAAPSDVPDDVQAVVKMATKRLLERLAQSENLKTDAMGPFSSTFVDSPENVFNKGELDFLRRFRTKSGLFTIDTTRGERARYDDFWLTDNPYLPEWVDQFHAIPPLPERGWPPYPYGY